MASYELLSTLFLWCLSLVPLSSDDGEKIRISLTERVEIIKSVKNRFRSGCVFLVKSADLDSEDAMLHTHDLVKKQKLLSTEHVAVSTLSLHDNLTDDQCGRNRLLLVLSGHQHLGTLRKVPKKIYFSEFIWLLFLEVATPLEELFIDINVPFDCEFLVAQREDEYLISLAEVYRTSEKFPLQVYRYGNWTSADGLTWPSIGLFERRSDLQGLVIRAGFKNKACTPKDLEACGRSSPSGFYLYIWRQLEMQMNFTTEYHHPMDNAYGTKTRNGSWTGVIGMLDRQEVDVCNADMTVVSERIEVVDFTVPLLNVRYYLMIKGTNSFDFNWNAFMDPFSSNLWIAIFLISVVCSVCLTATHHLKSRFGNPDIENFNILTAAFLIIGVFSMQGHSITTNSTTIRMIFLTSYLTAVIVLASYSAAFISYLTLRNPRLPFTDFRGFFEDGTYKLLIMRNTAQLTYFNNSRVELLKDIYSQMGEPYEYEFPTTELEGLKQACADPTIAYLGSSNYMVASRNRLNCTLVQIPQAFFPASLAIATTKRSPYRRLFNHRLQTMRRDGILNSLDRLLSYKLQDSDQPMTPAINFVDFLPILCVLVTGICIAGFALALEMWCRRTLRKYVTNT